MFIDPFSQNTPYIIKTKMVIEAVDYKKLVVKSNKRVL